ncbi:MAG: hypothetical protein A2719_02390 [Candidatus Ryanbacteria bacterium RIFCSPHIGHO2_01_FULL_45_22]|uniref:Transferase n=1 Tax=Candidatus Ryanbacteria bacterium RIFCSPHIGHO2_01_FULL_45_22 TaxID=1802114 RepID=A0A1G2G250_9BACT|nr:MAG: hypothetical protein A2719_02390 [Candidatus Ryanbacteria bacterium RIFCSPHIGHO2_01_FULL_45_22]
MCQFGKGKEIDMIQRSSLGELPGKICPSGAGDTIFAERLVLGKDVYIGPNMQLIGTVYLRDGVHIMGNTVFDGTDGPIYIESRTKVEPGVFIVGPATIGEDSKLRAKLNFRKSTCGNNCDLRGEIGSSMLGNNIETYASCIIHDSSCGDHCKLGAHINRTTMGHRVSAKYGDSNLLDGEMGDDINVSAGTTFYNFNGTSKKKTVVNSGSFIGGKIVAPCRIGKNVYMVAGLTIRQDIPDDTYVDPKGNFRPNVMQNDGNGHWMRIKS